MKAFKGGVKLDGVIRNVLKGDTSAFSEVMKCYEKSIYTYLYRLCGNREDAADLTQDTFIKAYNNLHRFNINMDFKPWIYRIAHNNYINHVKSKKDYALLDDEELPDTITPEDIVIGNDSIKAIDSILKSIPYMYRAVFILRIIDELPFKDIGSILKISESSARMRYLRVRKKLGSLLKGGNNDEMQLYR
jgi:RNA polymerase sigma-70 factor (ECF subfamily)